MAPRPAPTAAIMNASPTPMPAIAGMVRRSPCVTPDDSTRMLFGPGVKAITVANTTKAIKSGCDMGHSSDLRHDRFRGGAVRRERPPARQQHDGDAADHGKHARKPQRSETLAE